MSDELLKLRNEIDRLDEEILARLCERALCAQRVGEVKQGEPPFYRPEREAQVLRRLAELNPGPLPADAVKSGNWEEVTRLSREAVEMVKR